MRTRFLLAVTLTLFTLSVMADTPQKMTFSTLSRGTEHRDIRSEIVIQQAYGSLGIQVDIVPLPGQRALQYANSGRYDGELRRSNVDPELYPNLIKIPVAVHHLEICAYSTRTKADIATQADLNFLTVGVQRGGSVSSKLANNAHRKIQVAHLQQLIQMLKHGRIEAAIGNCDIVKRYLIANAEAGIHIHRPALISKPLYHHIHRSHQPMVPQITHAIKKFAQ